MLSSFIKSKNKRTGTIVKMIAIELVFMCSFCRPQRSDYTQAISYNNYKPGLQRYGMVIGLGVPLKLLKIIIITSVDGWHASRNTFSKPPNSQTKEL